MQVTHSLDNNSFELRFPVYNGKHKDISKFFGFDVINMLYLINKNDIIEQNHTLVTSPIVNRDDVGEASVGFLFYHLFKDCGMPQYYLNMKMILKIHDNIMRYTSEVIHDTPDFVENLSARIRQPKPIPISKMDIQVEIPGPSMAVVTISFSLDNKGPGSISHRTRMVTMIFKQMFNRLKEFIESVP